LLESELFGFTKGSFSGALHTRVGLIAASHSGTLFLDEIAELPLDAQAALLRVLQEREVMPIGATRAQPVDLRVISASHRNLEAEVASGRFRADLFGRLRGFQLVLPALRDRREDLGMIVRALLARVAPGREYTLSHAAARRLFAWPWPGNVRELERTLQLATVLARGDVLEVPEDDARVEPGSANALAAALAPALVGPVIDRSERHAELERLLREHRGNVTRVARAMGKAREQVHRWIKRAGLDLNRFRS
jgi:DNA-binding NtrC family response regulator